MAFRISFIFFLLILPFFSSAQKFRLDTNYVDSFKEKFILVFHASGQYNSLEIEQAVTDSTQTSLAYPTLKSSLGFTFNYKWFNFSYGRNIFEYFLKDYYEEKLMKSGPATIKNYGFTYAPNRFRIELKYRKVEGFHEENRQYYDSGYTEQTPFYQYPDMVSRNFGGDIIWTYNIRKRFSFGAPYSYTTRQRKSAGSFLFYLGANYFDVTNAGGSYIPREVASNFGFFDDLKSFRGTTLSVGAGWSYTLVIAKVFFVNATVIARYPFMFKEYETASGELLTEKTVPEDPEAWAFAIGRCAAGINFKSFFISAYAYTDMYDYRYYTNKQLGLGIRNFNVKAALNVGFRFNKLRKKETRKSI